MKPVGARAFAILTCWFWVDAVCWGAEVTVLDQPPLSGLSAILDGPPPSRVSDSACGVGRVPTTRSIADDFVVSGAIDLNVATWIGGYQRLDIPGSSPSFRLILHQDAAGIPAATIASFVVTPATTLLFSGLVLGQPSSAYLFEARFPAVHFEPGSYWLEIFETDGATTDCFEWVLGSQDPVRGRDGDAFSASAPGASWSANLRSDAFDNRALVLASDLAIVEVPTVGGWGLATLATALACGGWRRLRRQPVGSPRDGVSNRFQGAGSKERDSNSRPALSGPW